MKFLLFLLGLFTPAAFAAQSGGVGGISTLAPQAGDLSVSLLSSVFGVVDGILNGTGSQVLGNMFGVYNAAILTMGMVILVYIFVVSTLNTAHEGEVMGKKWSSIWIPLRTVAGIGLLLPKASGYSFIQILVMWVVVQGVGAANLIWNSTLDYLNRGGVIVQPPVIYAATITDSYVSGYGVVGTQGYAYQAGLGGQTSQRSVYAAGVGLNNNTFLIPIAGTILKTEACMYALQNILTSSNSGKNVPPVGGTLSPKPDPNNSGNLRMLFPGDYIFNGTNYAGRCGSVSWTPTDDGALTNNPANLTYSDSRSVAVRQMAMSLQPMAQQLANTLAPVAGEQSSSLQKVLEQNENRVFYSTIDYMGIMVPYLQKQSTDSSRNQAIARFVDEAKKVGWVLAGSYFFDMAKIQRSLNVKETEVTTAQLNDLATDPLLSSLASSLSRSALCPSASTGSALLIDQYICQEKTRNDSSSSANQVQPNLPGASSSPAPNTLFTQATAVNPAASKGEGSIYLSPVTGGIGDLNKTMNQLYGSIGNIYSAQTLGGSPILLVATMGLALVNAVESIWVTSLIAIGVVIGVAGLMVLGTGAPGVSLAFISIVMWLLPLITAILIPLLVAGATMAYYVPLIPYILFTFGALVWFASVIEAMIAAPLIALGLAHPEGHEHLGRAEYSVMLLANVFLRPALMIFGLIAGMILSSIMLWLLNYGFAKVWSNLQADWLGGVIYFVATMLIYTTLVTMLISRSFSLIYEVPNKVLRWVGGQTEQTMEAGALEEAKGSVSSGMQTASDALGSKGLSGSGEAFGGFVKGRVESNQGKGKGKEETDASGSGGGSGAAGGAPM